MVQSWFTFPCKRKSGSTANVRPAAGIASGTVEEPHAVGLFFKNNPWMTDENKLPEGALFFLISNEYVQTCQSVLPLFAAASFLKILCNYRLFCMMKYSCYIAGNFYI